MANILHTTVITEGTREAVLYFTLTSDGTQETNTVIYDSSVIATAIGITDPLNCNIQEIMMSAGAASTARIVLMFAASTPVLAVTLPIANGHLEECYEKLGGLKNYAGAGKTGDITLTTTGLASGDAIHLVLRVRTS